MTYTIIISLSPKDLRFFFTASKHCGSGLKNDFVVFVVVVADVLLSFKNELNFL